MKTSLVMTIIGDDKPGLVEWISSLVADHDGNWLESRMAHLAGQFAGILHVEVPRDQEAALVEALRQLENRGLQVLIAESAPTASSPDRIVRLELVGQDRPGIVRQISRCIASRGVNVEELQTGSESAPMSGEILFRAVAKLRVPDDVSLEDLKAALEQVGHDLMVDITLEDVAS